MEHVRRRPRIAARPIGSSGGLRGDRLSRIGKLAAAVALVVGIVVTGATLAEGTDHRSADRTYLARLGVPANDSAAVGSTFERVLSQGHLKSLSALRTLDLLVQRQQSDQREIQSITPPPALRTEQMEAEVSFLMRTNGLSGFVAGVREKHVSAQTLASIGYRLVTSDILWQLFVQEPIATELGREGVDGLTPPGSVFLATPDAVSPDALSRALSTAPATASGGPAATEQLLKLGSSGAQVAAWQQQLRGWLNKESLPVTVAVNGTFDPATQTATMRLQQSAGLTVDGVVGPLTRAALRRAAGKPK
jgi:hypothetical protein